MFQKFITTLIDDGLGLLMTSHFVDYHFGYNGSTCSQWFFPWFLKKVPLECVKLVSVESPMAKNG